MPGGEMTIGPLHVYVSVEKVSGPFASKDEIAEQLVEAIEASLGSEQPSGENGGEYEVTDVEVYND
jgi:hypothetical protein